MKKSYILLMMLGFLFSISNVVAQVPIKTTDDVLTFGNTQSPGVWVNIPETSVDNIRKDWVKILERGTKSKALVNGKEVTIFGAQAKELAGDPINIFSIVEEKDSSVMIFASIELKRDEFITKDSPQYTALNNMLLAFAKEKYTAVAEGQLAQESKKLKDLEKSLESLRKTKDKLEKEIKSDQTTIDQENYKIVNAQKELAEHDRNLDSKGTELAKLDAKEERKAKESEIKDLQKKKKSSQKDIASSESKISKSTNNIADNNTAIAVNLKEQSKVMTDIADQTMRMRNYESKLNTIKAY